MAAASVTARPVRRGSLPNRGLVNGFERCCDKKSRRVEHGPEQTSAVRQDRSRDNYRGGQGDLHPGRRSVGEQDVQDTPSPKFAVGPDKLAHHMQRRLQNHDPSDGPEQSGEAGQPKPDERGDRGHKHEHERVRRVLADAQIRSNGSGQREGYAHP
jgi:hypothetical protein